MISLLLALENTRRQLLVVLHARLLLLQQLPAYFGNLPLCRVNTAALVVQ